MRLQLILLALFTCFSCVASSPDKEMNNLFFNYDAVMKDHKFDLIDEVFTKKFLEEVGGKEEFIQTIKEYPKDNNKSNSFQKLSFKKGSRDEMYFAKREEAGTEKSRVSSANKSSSSFVIKKENGKLKIDGTISDDH
jgi:hypothetical protein